jgi:hypothetical protein
MLVTIVRRMNTIRLYRYALPGHGHRADPVLSLPRFVAMSRWPVAQP